MKRKEKALGWGIATRGAHNGLAYCPQCRKIEELMCSKVLSFDLREIVAVCDGCGKPSPIPLRPGEHRKMVKR